MLFPLWRGFLLLAAAFIRARASDTMGRWGSGCFFGGFNMNLLLMHLTVCWACAGRVYTYDAEMGWGG